MKKNSDNKKGGDSSPSSNVGKPKDEIDTLDTSTIRVATNPEKVVRVKIRLLKPLGSIKADTELEQVDEKAKQLVDKGYAEYI